MIEWNFHPETAPRDGTYIYVLMPGRKEIHLVRFEENVPDLYFPWIVSGQTANTTPDGKYGGNWSTALSVSSFIAWRPKGAT